MLYGDRSYKKVPQYDKNELRPNQRTPLSKDGEGRGMLDYAQGNMMIQDYGDHEDRSPASATWTPGLPSRSKSKPGDEGEATIQPGIRRP